VADEYTPEMLAQLEAQIAYFRSDDRIREEVALWADATPEQRLAELPGMCAAADHFLSRLDPAALERALAPEPLPADSIAVLSALRHAAR
jgi:hypothetical protein